MILFVCFVCLNLLNIYLAALVGILHLRCSMRAGSFLWHVESSTQAKDRTRPLCTAACVCRDRACGGREAVWEVVTLVLRGGDGGWRLGLRAANLGRKGQIQDMLPVRTWSLLSDCI